MADVIVNNTTTDLSGKTLVVAENSATVTGLLTFDRDPSAPIAVTAGSAVVTNLDADMLDGLHASNFLSTTSSPTVTGLITFDRDPGPPFAVTSGSAKVDNLDADLLDGHDSSYFAAYSAGTWTPAITGTGGGSGQTYSAQTGRYIRVGDVVHVWGRIVLTAKGTITGGVRISGFPVAEAPGISTIPVGYFLNMTSTMSDVVGIMSGSTTMDLYAAIGAAVTSVSALASGDLSNTTEIRFAGSYPAA